MCNFANDRPIALRAWHISVGGLLVVALASAAAAGTPTVYRGLLHTPVGDAGLVVDGSRLRIRNLPSAGDSGVDVDVHGAEGWFVGVEEIVEAQPNWSATFSARAIDDLGTMFDAATLQVTPGASNVQHDLLLRPTPSTIRVRLLLGQTITGQGVLSGQPDVAIIADRALSNYSTQWAGFPLNGKTETRLGFGTAANVTIPGVATNVPADRVQLRAAYPGETFVSLAAAEIRGSDLIEIVLDDAGLIQFNHRHSGVDGVRQTVDAGELLLNQLTPDAANGLEIMFPAAGVFGVQWRNVDPGMVPDGATLQFAPSGAAPWGVVGVVKDAGSLNLTGDLSLLSPTGFVVEVFDGRTQVASIPTTAIPTASVAGELWPNAVQVAGEGPADNPFVALSWSGEQSFLVGGMPFTGDQLRFVAVDPGVDTSFLDTLRATGEQHPIAAIIDEERLPPPCPNDANGEVCDGDIAPLPGGDCVVNNQDLGLLLSAYLSDFGDPSYLEEADLYPPGAPDGTINNLDLAEVLADYLNNCQ